MSTSEFATGHKMDPAHSLKRKVKQQQSCDACRIRKVKCEIQGEDVVDGEVLPGKTRPTCKHCLGVGLHCQYEYVLKKRGPPNLYIKRLEAAKAQSSTAPDSAFRPVRTSSKPRRPIPDRSVKNVYNEHQVLPPSSDVYTDTSFGQYIDPGLVQTFAAIPLDKAGRDGGSTHPVSREVIESFERTPVGSGDEEEPLVDTHDVGQLTRSEHVNHDFLNERAEPRAGIIAPYQSDAQLGYSNVLNTGRRDDGGLIPPATELSPSIYGRINLNYVKTPSDNGSTVASNYHFANTVSLNEDLGPKSYSSQGDGTTIRSRNLGQPVHELQSGTLGDIGRIYPSFYATYTSPTAEYLASASPNLSRLLNPDPLSRAALLPLGYAHSRSPIDAILPRPLLHVIIGLFKDFVYPLTPCIHMPTLLQDLAKRREMEAGQEEWTAMVLATVMSTVVQVPRAFVPLSRGEVSALAERCYMETRKWSMSGYSDSITVNAVIVNYFRAVYNYVRDRSAASCHASLFEAQALATVLKLHEEDSYALLNPIEREMRRRIFFLLFCADKSESVLLGRPVKMREEDCCSLRLPEELDDEYITEARYLHQPRGFTSLITGFNASIRIYCLIGRTITKWRDDKRTRPMGNRLDARIKEVNQLLEEVMNSMKGCPPELKLKGSMDSRVQSPSREFARDAEQVLQELFFDPKASREYARDAYLVQAGNIYVNQQLARFVLLQYQHELLSLKDADDSQPTRELGGQRSGWINASGMSMGGVTTEITELAGMRQPGCSTEVAARMAANEETLFYDLLTMLHSIPIQCIAVNGPALVNSVRYIASALLDTVAVGPEIQGKINLLDTEQSNSVLRAQGYLIEFLSILSDIEKHYSWSNVNENEVEVV